ncbi:MAG: PAS domain S-box protein, partial [Campylobacterota bacterium]|nr:PAS domain S-box protein [Campylobacterota bacterium]
YSNYPFLNRKDRVLTPFQKKAILEVEKNKDGLYIQKDIIDGKPVLRVAIADYLVQSTCVDCHNSHKLKDWESNKWKLGDKRGVLEIITPLEKDFNQMYFSRTKVIIPIIVLMFLLLGFYTYVLVKREKEFNQKNELLSENFADLFDDFDKNVIASKTDLHGNIVYASKKFCQEAGYAQEQLIGSSHNIIRHPDMPKEFFKKLWNDLTQDKVWSGEIKNRANGGITYWVYAVISPMYNEKKEKIGYSAIRQDITHKKKLEEANTKLKIQSEKLQHLNENLEKEVEQEVEKTKQKDQQMLHQSRLAQMGEMISMIAHQWRQPLSAINSASMALNVKARLGTSDEKTTLEQTQNITDYAQHLSTTIDDFREFFKPNKEKRETNYTTLVHSVLAIIESSIVNQNISIDKELNCEKSFNSYPNEIKQVILNLVKNSEDILIDNNIDEPFIKIKTYEQEGLCVLEVSDNGGGVPQDIINNIFNPYFSTKTKKDGTGLGLYMSKTIIEEHCEGKLNVANNEYGAVFTIILGELKNG